MTPASASGRCIRPLYWLFSGPYKVLQQWVWIHHLGNTCRYFYPKWWRGASWIVLDRLDPNFVYFGELCPASRMEIFCSYLASTLTWEKQVVARGFILYFWAHGSPFPKPKHLTKYSAVKLFSLLKRMLCIPLTVPCFVLSAQGS